jgi:lipopolysaccharide cholinephosphotransferase
MLSNRDIINKINKGNNILLELCADELKAIQQVLLSIFIDINTVCKKYSLDCFLGGGTLLGAVRHKGFIPWDDDLDLLMPRKDYEQFIEVFEKELSNEYIIIHPHSENNEDCPILRVFKKNTTYIHLWNAGTSRYKGVNVEIHPVENIPNSRVKRLLHGIISDALFFISTSCVMKVYKNPYLKKFINHSIKAKIFYFLRVTIGYIVSFNSPKKWLQILDNWNSKYKNFNDSDFMSIPCGRKHYFGEVINRNILFPKKTILFENIVSDNVNDHDFYLRNLYRNYMRIPKQEEREKHFIISYNLFE